jgi:flagellar capping protein FliD
MSMSVDGLISGMDTTTLISKLLEAEAGPQLALKKKLSASQTAASAYRTVNTTFAAVRAAAEAVLKPENWTTTKGSASVSGVAVSTSNGALPGSVSFKVVQLSANHAMVNRNPDAWKSKDAAYGATSIEIFDNKGVSKGPALPPGRRRDARRRRRRHQQELLRRDRRRGRDQPHRVRAAAHQQDLR